MNSDLSHFRLPDDGRHRTINFSGGRSSAFLLYKVLEAHDGKLPPYATAIFANTGKEHEETLEFVKRCEEEWDVPIVWLEYDVNPNAKGGIKDPKHIHRVVSFDTASRNGEPFKTLIQYKSAVPNWGKRFCTEELKVNTIIRYLRREHGIAPVRQHGGYGSIDVLGIRFDERRRWGKAIETNCRTEYPFVWAEVVLRDIDDFWANNSFDLTLYEPRANGNCDLCFLKSRGNMFRAIRRDPTLTRWWEELEEQVGAQFNVEHSYKELRDMALATPELPLFEDDDNGGISCFCGD